MVVAHTRFKAARAPIVTQPAGAASNTHRAYPRSVWFLEVDPMIRVPVLAGLLLVATSVSAVEVEGVTLPERLVLPPDEIPLVLNGAGKRSKFFVSIYVGALYLPTARGDAKAILDAVEPRRVAMHFVYDRVEAHKLRDAWEAGFVDNQDAQTLANLRERLDRFKALFGDAVAGDVVWLDFVPGQSTRVSFNGTLVDSIPGDDFNRALLAVWLGDEPADSSLKRGMLGG